MNNDIVPSRLTDTASHSSDDVTVEPSHQPEGYRPQSVHSASSGPDKQKRGKAVPVLAVLLLLALLGGALLAYLWLQERAESRDTREAIAALQEENSAFKAAADEGDAVTEQDTNPLSQEEQVLLESSNYYCQVEGFGCEKVNAEISKIQKHELNPSQPGFAVVKAGSSNGGTMNLYLKSVDGLQWVVIYDGTNAPPQDVVAKFAIPQDFSSAE